MHRRSNMIVFGSFIWTIISVRFAHSQFEGFQSFVVIRFIVRATDIALLLRWDSFGMRASVRALFDSYSFSRFHK